MLHKGPGKKIQEAEEKAAKALRIADVKEDRAMRTGRLEDQKEAVRARLRAEEMLERVVQVERKERRKSQGSGRGKVKGVVRVGKNRRGETVIIQG